MLGARLADLTDRAILQTPVLGALRARPDALEHVPAAVTRGAAPPRLEEVLLAYGEAVRRAADPWLGLALGAARDLGFLGPLAGALSSAPTVRAAVEAATRYLPLLAESQRLVLQGRGERCALRTTLPFGLDPDGTRVVLQSTVVIMANVFDAAFPGANLPTVLHFEGPPPPPGRDAAARRPWRALRYRAKHHELELSTAYLGLRPAAACDERHARVSAALAEELRRREGERDLLERARFHLHAGLLEGPRVATLARALGVAPRTLQLHLTRRGTSFQAELAAVRVEIARRYLEGTDEPIAVIGSRVGLRSAEAFTRFFRAETGRSPSEHRAAARPTRGSRGRGGA